MQQALIHILCAELSCPLRGTAAVVGIDPIHTNPSILTLVVRTVIYIPLTGDSFKTWKAAALKGKVTSLPAGPSVDTGGGCTGHVGAIAVLACEALGALALIGAWEVEAGAAVLALSWNVTLIDISLTFLPCEACEACAGELVGHSGTGTSICTGVGQAGISPLAQFTCKTDLAGALIGVPAKHVARASIQAGLRHKAGVRSRVLAVLAREAQGTSARGFPQHSLGHTCPTILATVLLTGVSMLTIFSQEALWTFAVSCTVVVGNTYSLIYTRLIAIPTLQCTRRGRAAQPQCQQRPQRSGAQGGHLLGRLLLRRRRLGRSTWGGGPDRGAPTDRKSVV